MKLKIALAVLFFCYLLTPEWCLPGDGLHRAAQILSEGNAFPAVCPSLWGCLVGAIGWNARGLELISMCAAAVCSVALAGIVGDLCHYVIGKVCLRRAPGTYRFEGVTSSAIVLTVLSFFLVPEHLVASTRIHPLTTAYALLLLAIWIVVHRACTTDGPIGQGLKRKLGLVFSALALLAAGLWEFVAMGRLLCEAAWTAISLFLLVGLVPMLILVYLIQRRRSIDSSGLTVYLIGWMLALVCLGLLAFPRMKDGLDVVRIAKQVVKSAEGRSAIVSNGQFDDVFRFLKSPDQYLISISVAENVDAASRRELVGWAKEKGLTNLVWAAKIGPRTFIDAWRQDNPTNYAQCVQSPETYFPTIEDWQSACQLLNPRKQNFEKGDCLLKLLSAAGNGLACQFLEKGMDHEAWNIFWIVIEKVDRCNCTAIANLYAMIKRGYRPSPAEQDRLSKLNKEVVTQYRSARALLKEAFAGGRVYIKSAGRGKIQNESTVFDVTGGVERENEFIAAISRVPCEEMDVESARAVIRRGLAAGLIRLTRLGPQLLRLDLMLNDWDAAERDAQDVLKLNKLDSTAHRTLGLIKLRSRDFSGAEQSLRAAFDIESPNSWEDYELFARVRIRNKNLLEGERMLQKAIRLAANAGIDQHKIPRFTIDSAWIAAFQKNEEELNRLLKLLSDDQSFSNEEQLELEELRHQM